MVTTISSARRGGWRETARNLQPPLVSLVGDWVMSFWR
jgi:hypothetical protein